MNLLHRLLCVITFETDPWQLRKDAAVHPTYLISLHAVFEGESQPLSQPTFASWQQCYSSLAACCSSSGGGGACLWTLKSTRREEKKQDCFEWKGKKNLGAQPCKLICSCCMMGTQLASLTCTQQIIIAFFFLLSSASQCLANGLAGLIMSERNYTGPRET